MESKGLIATTEQRMVLGLGVTGCSVARWWRKQGVPFVAADTRPAMANSLEIKRTVGFDTELFFGDFDLSIIDGISELVVSPGVAMDHPVVRRALAGDTRVIGDIDLFVEQAKAPVIGITGSNGKSTVTGMLGAMIEACGKRVALGGNFGIPALDLLDDGVEYYVLELSSFQLERSEPLNLAAATVLNISADHLDRHGSLPLYHYAKHRIFRGAKAVVANRADPLTIPLLEEVVPVELWRPTDPDLNEFGVRSLDGEAVICRGFEPLLPVDELLLSGEHNASNALVALALGIVIGLPLDGLLVGLKSFRGLPHRCQLVAKQAGVRWINDSKGTNVGATKAALSGLGNGQNIVLIAGGAGKGQDFSEMLSVAQAHCKCVLTIGESAEEIELVLRNSLPVQRVADIETAVIRANELADDGDIVLLSPACASFDMFTNYKARGVAFGKAVQMTLDGIR